MSLWRRKSCRILHEGGKLARVHVPDHFKTCPPRRVAARAGAAARRRARTRTNFAWRSLEGDRCEPEIVFVHISARTQGVAGINVQAAPRHQVSRGYKVVLTFDARARRIRAVGPPVNELVSPAGKRMRTRRQGRSHRSRLCSGTKGSNPLSSTGESVANLFEPQTPENPARARATLSESREPGRLTASARNTFQGRIAAPAPECPDRPAPHKSGRQRR
jgi:hypothetical protein